MKSFDIIHVVLTLFALSLISSCATLPPSDPHITLEVKLDPLKGTRLDEGHIGEQIEIPVPGKVTVLDFWASHCPPCVQAMPRLEQIWQKVDKTKVAIIGISEDETDAVSRKTLAEVIKTPITFPMVFDDLEGTLQAAYQVGGTIPATYVIDKQGHIRFFFDGSEGDMERLEQAITALSAE